MVVQTLKAPTSLSHCVQRQSEKLLNNIIKIIEIMNKICYD